MNLNKALVIDDEKEIGMLLSTILSKMGLKTMYASNLDMGLSMFEELRPQVIFLDINLPDGSGFSLVPKFKNSNQVPKVVVITARDGDQERAMAAQLGVDFVLPKPLSRKSVVDVLERLGNGVNGEMRN